MNRHSKLPARFLLGLLGAVLITAGMTSVSLASRTYYYGDYFAVVEAESNYAWFSPSIKTVTMWTKTAQ